MEPPYPQEECSAASPPTLPQWRFLLWPRCRWKQWCRHKPVSPPSSVPSTAGRRRRSECPACFLRSSLWFSPRCSAALRARGCRSRRGKLRPRGPRSADWPVPGYRGKGERWDRQERYLTPPRWSPRWPAATTQPDRPPVPPPSPPAKPPHHAPAGSQHLSLIHISEPTRLRRISYAVFCLKKKKKKQKK